MVYQDITWIVQVKLSWRSTENSDVFTRKPDWWKLFSLVAGLESIPAISMKTESITKVSPRQI